MEKILPEAPEFMNDGLRQLTRHLMQAGYEEDRVGFLGGPDGYGVEFENEVFMMYPFCWCDDKDCPWCMQCDCPAEATKYYIDGKEVTYNKWIKFFDREIAFFKNASVEEYEKAVERINKRRQIIHTPVCQFCTEGRFPETGAIPGKEAPNFWFKGTDKHKPLRVWWYKWIGRDMVIDREISQNEWEEILSLCINSVEPY